MNKLAINQSDRLLSKYDEVKRLPVPKKGWIKYIRTALSMTGEQLAKRLGVSKRRVVAIESSEIEGALTLKSLDDAARALNCRLIYAIVPDSKIQDIIENQAREYVEKHLVSVAHNMALEAQSVEDKKAIEAQIDDLVQEYLSKPSKVIWDV